MRNLAGRIQLVVRAHLRSTYKAAEFAQNGFAHPHGFLATPLATNKCNGRLVATSSKINCFDIGVYIKVRNGI